MHGYNRPSACITFRFGEGTYLVMMQRLFFTVFLSRHMTRCIKGGRCFSRQPQKASSSSFPKEGRVFFTALIFQFGNLAVVSLQ
jgi:hypothetical protein